MTVADVVAVVAPVERERVRSAAVEVAVVMVGRPRVLGRGNARRFVRDDVMYVGGARARCGTDADRDDGGTCHRDDRQGCESSTESASEHCTHVPTFPAVRIIVTVVARTNR